MPVRSTASTNGQRTLWGKVPHAIKLASSQRIFEEHASGKITPRPELEACLKALRAGDTLVVWRLDCLGRS